MAQDVQRSECLAMANAPPRATPVGFRRCRQNRRSRDHLCRPRNLLHRYPWGHPDRHRLQWRLPDRCLPDIVTMNLAHGTHYTLFPDPKIPHVFHGWGENGQPAHVAMRIGDVYIRNVTTDIRRYWGEGSGGEMIKDGNSIFTEVAGLRTAISHLHHKLDETHFAARWLDIVMVPIDGTYTMSLDGISDITRRLRASVVLPMHRFATPLDEFAGLIGQQFQIDQRAQRTLKISRRRCRRRRR